VLLGTYRIDRLLGRGGMGSVYAATHVHLQTPCAIKVLLHEFSGSDASEALKRFQREAQITSQLGHPNIVRVTDFNFTPDGSPFMVMELLAGETLQRRLRTRGPLTLAETVFLIGPLCDALGLAHTRGVVHRDLKPENIFLPSESGLDGAKILDFGISKIRDGNTRLTQADVQMGTQSYMAPEIVCGAAAEADIKSDVFSLGAILYEVLTGKMAYDGPNAMAVMYKLMYQPAPRAREILPDLPEPVEAVILHALAREPADRIQTAPDLFAELTAAALPFLPTQEEATETQSSRYRFTQPTMQALRNSGALSLTPGTGSRPGTGPQGTSARPGTGPQGTSARPGTGPQGTAPPGAGPLGPINIGLTSRPGTGPVTLGPGNRGTGPATLGPRSAGISPGTVPQAGPATLGPRSSAGISPGTVPQAGPATIGPRSSAGISPGTGPQGNLQDFVSDLLPEHTSDLMMPVEPGAATVMSRPVAPPAPRPAAPSQSLVEIFAGSEPGGARRTVMSARPEGGGLSRGPSPDEGRAGPSSIAADSGLGTATYLEDERQSRKQNRGGAVVMAVIAGLVALTGVGFLVLRNRMTQPPAPHVDPQLPGPAVDPDKPPPPPRRPPDHLSPKRDEARKADPDKQLDPDKRPGDTDDGKHHRRHHDRELPRLKLPTLPSE
jgi:serine/threonine-protein kinase